MFALVGLAASLATHAAVPVGSDYYLYKVRPHETFSEIGRRGLQPASAYLTVWRLNGVPVDRELPIGKVLRIPRSLLRTAPIRATVEGFGGAATASENGGVRPLSVGLTVPEGAVISTGPNAFVRLALPDGSHLAVPSNSRIRLDRLRLVVLTGALDRQVSVQAGGLDSQVTPMTNPASRYVVMTPVAQSSVRGTEFRVAYDAGHARATAGVLKGVVGVANARTDIKAEAGQGVVATPAGLKGPFPLLPAPVPTGAGALQSGERLHFEFMPVAGAARYRVAIAADAKVQAPLYETVVDRPAADAPAPKDGVYYLRLTAISREGLEGQPGITSFIRNRGELTILGAAPGPGGTTEFRWTSPGDPPPIYRFVLAPRADRDHPILSQDNLSEGRIVASTPPGDYVWLVFARRVVDGRRVQLVSDPQSLHVP